MEDLLAHITEDLLTNYSDAPVRDRTECIHFHNSYELVLGVQAENECFLRDTGYPFLDRTLFFVPVRQLHIIQYKKDAPYARYVVNFSDGFIRNTLSALGCPALLDTLSAQQCLCTHLSPQQYMTVQPLFHALCQSGKQKVDFPRARGLLSLLLMETARLLEETPAPLGTQLTAPELMVRSVVAWLDEHYAEDITLDQLALRFYVSKYYLCHIFRKITGSGLIDYLQCRRILEAQKLLMQGGLNTQQITLQCGFHNTQHFYRVFRRVTGSTPGRYRLPKGS